MAKKDKKKKDKQSSGPSDPLESVRSAVERTLKATGEGTAGAQKHARELVDEVAHAANRFREAMGELKVLDELKKEVAGLRQRVAALEGKAAATSSAGPRRTATRSTAAKRTAAKPAASRSRSTAAKKPAASRSRSTAAKKPAAKSTGTASRSRSTAAKKPAATRSGSTGSSGASGSSSSS